jgi:hypothetical protein
MGLEDIIGGTIDAVVNDTANGKGQHYEIDLRRARLMLSSLGWSKGIGVPGKLVFDMIQAADGYRVENLKLTGDGFGLSGKVALDGKYNLISADIDEFALRKGDQAAFTLKRDAKGGYIVNATGKTFDIRGLMTRFRKPPPGGSTAPDLTVDARFDRLIGFNNEVLSKGEMAITAASGTLRRLDIKGTLGNSVIGATYSDDSRSANLLLTTADAGAFFRYIDLYQRIVGGTLRLQGRRANDAEPLLGAFDISNFHIVGEQVMSRFASSTDRSDGFNPNAVPFDRMQLNYTLRNSVIVIDDAVLRSPSIGATFDGRIDLAASQILIQGTYLPAYAINNMFGKIPVLGLALGGGSKGGLVGITFKVEGPMDNPGVQINALSAIAPGMFRKIFEFH